MLTPGWRWTGTLPVDNPGVADLERAAKEFFAKAESTFSPFDRGTFESLLRSAAAHLDANGVYWPSVAAPEDRTLPKPDDKLKVTDMGPLRAPALQQPIPAGSGEAQAASRG